MNPDFTYSLTVEGIVNLSETGKWSANASFISLDNGMAVSAYAYEFKGKKLVITDVEAKQTDKLTKAKAKK